MKNFLTVLAFIGAVVCSRTLEEIIVDVVNDTNINPKDDFISMDELSVLVLSHDLDGDGKVEKHEFTTTWINRYDDNHADTNTFFNNLDYDKSHALDNVDLEYHMYFGHLDGNRDGNVTVAEFTRFIRLMHPGHGNH